MRTRLPLSVGLLLLLCWIALAMHAQIVFAQAPMVPLASEAERLLAQLLISVDGRTLTIRGAAPDDLRICVEPLMGQFGHGTICYRAGELRRGLK
jgi:hypothetical protein